MTAFADIAVELGESLYALDVTFAACGKAVMTDRAPCRGLAVCRTDDSRGMQGRRVGFLTFLERPLTLIIARDRGWAP
jgi:hypothetical protein